MWIRRSGFLLGLLMLVLGSTAVYADATPLDEGYFDFTYPSGTGAGGAATAEKPESKLWFHDGKWWASMWSDSGNAFHIFQLNMSNQTWVDTGIELDDRTGSLADALSDGNTLYVASHVWSKTSSSGSGGNGAEIYRYTYSGGSYSLDAGFPVEINNVKTESLTIAKDSTGMLWATWVASSKVMVTHSNASGGGDDDWEAPYQLPVTDSDVASDDLSAVVAFDGYIGIMYSRQRSGKKIYFAARQDGDDPNTWVGAPAYTTSGDDHINLKSLQSDSAGKVFAVVKTSVSNPSIVVLACDTAATNCANSNNWDAHTVYNSNYSPTRPILLIDTSNREMYVVVRLQEAVSGTGGDIYYKKSSLDNINFSSGNGTPFISSKTYKAINDPTSTKQSLTNATGLVVLASDDAKRAYVHGCLSLMTGDPCDSVLTVQFSTGSYLVDEASGTAEVEVLLSAEAEEDVTVAYTMSDGTATSDVDYTPSSGTLTFAVGETSQTISIPLIDETDYEEDETVMLTLSEPTVAEAGATMMATLTIVNDDAQPSVAFAQAEQSVGEVDGSTTVSVTLSAVSYETVLVDVVNADETAVSAEDYTTVNETLTFAPGELSKAVDVSILDDALFEGDETAVLSFENLQNGLLGTPDTLTLTITDDEAAPTVQLSEESFTIAENGGPQTVTVTLSSESGLPVTVELSTVGVTADDDIDYAAQDELITFAPGELMQTVAIDIIDDAIEEGNETFDVVLANPTVATLGTPPAATVTILDNDTPPTVQLTAAAYSGVEGDGEIVVTVEMLGLSTKTVTVDYETVAPEAKQAAPNPAQLDGSMLFVLQQRARESEDDYTPVSGTLSFAPGEMTREIIVPLTDDAFDEITETLSLELSNVVNGFAGEPMTATLTIEDDDAPPIIRFDDDDVEADEDAGTVELTIELSELSEKVVTVAYTSIEEIPPAANAAEAGLDYTPISGTLIFTPGTTSQTIVLTLLDDALDEVDESVHVALSAPENGTLDEPEKATITIDDNDSPPTVAFAAVEFVVDEDVDLAMITVLLDAPSGKTVTVDYEVAEETAVSGDDFEIVAGTLIFAPGETEQQFAIPVLEDDLEEDDETVLMTISGPDKATLGTIDEAMLLIVDNDTPKFSFDVAEMVVDEAAGTIDVTFALNIMPPTPVVVSYETVAGTADESDFTPTSGSITLFPNDPLVQTITIEIQDDTNNEGDEHFQVILKNPQGALLGRQSTLDVVITDNDEIPTVHFEELLVRRSEMHGYAEVIVMLSGASGEIVRVDYATTDGTATAGDDYMSVNGALLFNPGQTIQMITVPLHSDFLLEGGETVNVTLSNVEGATLGVETATVLITDGSVYLPVLRKSP